MAYVLPSVGYEDIDQSAPQLIAVSATPTKVLSSRLGQSFRNFFSISGVSAGVIVTITLGPVDVAANTGTPLTQYQPFSQSMDINRRGIYQGEIWVTASANGFVAVQETIENGGVPQ